METENQHQQISKIKDPYLENLMIESKNEIIQQFQTRQNRHNEKTDSKVVTNNLRALKPYFVALPLPTD